MRAVKAYTSFAKSSRRDVARRASRRERRVRRVCIVAVWASMCCVRWVREALVLSGPCGREEMDVMKGVYFSRISVKRED